MTRILGGDGSAWLRDIQQEEGMKPRHISEHRQTRGSAQQQQQMNRLQHTPWEHERRPEGSWWFAIAVAVVLIVVFGAGIRG